MSPMNSYYNHRSPCFFSKNSLDFRQCNEPCFSAIFALSAVKNLVGSCRNRFITEAEGTDYHIYLQVPKLTNGIAYTLKTPYGSTNFVFDDRQVFCESIKVNQSGY